MMNLYLIHSLKWSNTANFNGDAYWGPNDSGYTTNINFSGIYTEEQVINNRGYYDNGDSTKAILLDVKKMDKATIDRMLMHYNHKLRDEEELKLEMESLKRRLQSMEKAKLAVRQNLEKQLFELNQQLILNGEEPIKCH